MTPCDFCDREAVTTAPLYGSGSDDDPLGDYIMARFCEGHARLANLFPLFPKLKLRGRPVPVAPGQVQSREVGAAS